MSEAIIVAVIGLCGSGLGSLLGALVSGKLWQYRLEQLEKKVEKMSAKLEQTLRLKEDHVLFEERFKVVNHRISDLERREC
jgi:hypothetical protein